MYRISFGCFSLYIIKYIPLQQGLRPAELGNRVIRRIIKYIPLQQGLRP